VEPPGRALLAATPYPVLLAAGTLVLNAQPASRRAAWLAYASTNLANLSGHPLRSLVLSALVCEGDLVAWVLLGLAGLAAAGLRFGAWRALVLAVAVHVLATFASEGLVAYRIGTGALPRTARVISDVGPSYLVVAALVMAIGYGTRGGRIIGALGFGLLAPSLFDGLGELDVAAVGHVVSIGLVLALGWPVARWARTAGRREWPSADSNRGP
jgi:Rhomboid-like protein